MKINYIPPKPQTETDYARGVRKAMQAIAKSRKVFFIGCNDLPELVESLNNPPRQKPKVCLEYEKVEYEPEEIWKAFQEHQEKGHLFVGCKDGYESLGDGIFNLAMAISQGDQLYRRIEKSVDWRKSLNEWQHTAKVGIYTPLDMQVRMLIEDCPDKFLEMCRVALREKGEL